MSIHVFGLVHRPGLVPLPETARLRRNEVPLIDILAAAELDAGADVLVAHGRDMRARSLPLHDSLATPDAGIRWSRHQPARLVIPRWIEDAERFMVVSLQALTFAQFLRTPQMHDRSGG